MGLEAFKEVETRSVVTGLNVTKTGTYLNLISNNNLNSSIFRLVTKPLIPTPPQSPKPLSKNTPLTQQHVTSSHQHSYDSNIITIAQLLRNFSQLDIVPTTSVIEDFPNQLDDESSSNHNHLACVSDLDQSSPINVMPKPPFEIPGAKSSSTSSSSDSNSLELSPLIIKPLQPIPLKITSYVDSPHQNLVHSEIHIQSKFEQEIQHHSLPEQEILTLTSAESHTNPVQPHPEITPQNMFELVTLN